jgi:multicomponent Na+:H+ antiporter subunit G
MSELAIVRAVVTAALVVVGSTFLLIGTLGLLRLPNVYNRMHATSKAATLGATSIFLAGFVHFGPQGAGLVSLVGILFLYITVPTGAHMISRAARKMGVRFLPGVYWPRKDSENWIDAEAEDDPEPGDD